MERAARVPVPLLPCAQLAEVLGRLGDGVPEEAEDDPASLAALNLHIKENLVGDLFGVAVCDGGEKKLVSLQIEIVATREEPSDYCTALL